MSLRRLDYYGGRRWVLMTALTPGGRVQGPELLLAQEDLGTGVGPRNGAWYA